MSDIDQRPWTALGVRDFQPPSKSAVLNLQKRETLSTVELQSKEGGVLSRDCDPVVERGAFLMLKSIIGKTSKVR